MTLRYGTPLNKKRPGYLAFRPSCMSEMSLRSIFILLVAVSGCLSASLGLGQQQQGTLHRRSYFYVGQKYTTDGNLTIAADQMYVEHLTPAKVTHPLPLVIIHGMGMTGTNFLNTPDGRLGWADYFLSQGYEVTCVSFLLRSILTEQNYFSCTLSTSRRELDPRGSRR